MKILILAQECDATSMVYNAFKDEFEQVDLILEQKVDRKTFFKRRIKNLGWKKVLGQITFKILLEPFIKLQGKRRIKNIIQDYHLNPNKDYQMNHLYRVNSVNSDECRALLLKLKPDVVIVNGTRIISEKTLETTTAPFINMHTGITPKYRGVHGAYWALTQNDRQNCGVTIHRVDTGIDTGDILYQAAIPVTPLDNYYTYPYLQVGTGIKLEIKAVKDCENGTIKTISNTLPSRLWSHPTIIEYIKYRLKGIK